MVALAQDQQLTAVITFAVSWLRNFAITSTMVLLICRSVRVAP